MNGWIARGANEEKSKLKNIAILVRLLVTCSMLLSGCAEPERSKPQTTNKPATKATNKPEPYGTVGIASYYANSLSGRATASGERYDPAKLTAAHRYYSFGTRVRVKNLDNGRSTVVRINDRGPHRAGRIIDVSAAAAKELGLLTAGTAKVSIQVVEEAHR